MTMFNFGKARNKFVKLFAEYKPNEEVEHDFSNSDLSVVGDYYDVESQFHLPQRGKADVIYRTLDDMRLWSWARITYTEYNPYSFGIANEYREPVEKIVMSNTRVLDNNDDVLVLQDERQMCSISIDAIKEGADARLALAYNIDALRCDLNMLSELKISLGTMVTDKKDRPYRKNSEKQNLVDNWFYQEHTALSLLLRSSCRSAKHVDNNMLDCINRKGAHLWWDEEANNAKFKFGEFEVNL